MAIDVGLVIAQLVNFALLLLLLRRFLFRPIVRVMEERARVIALETAEAERVRAEAEAERAALTEARAVASQERRQLLAQAERDAAELRARREEELTLDLQRERVRVEADRAHRDHDRDARLADRVVPLLANALERAWRELADDDLGRHAQRAFLKRLQHLDDAERAALAESAVAGSISLACVPAPTPADAAALRGAVQALLTHPAEIAIDHDPDLIAGVALRVGDIRIEWSARAHRHDLERVWRAALAPDAEGAAA